MANFTIENTEDVVTVIFTPNPGSKGYAHKEDILSATTRLMEIKPKGKIIFDLTDIASAHTGVLTDVMNYLSQVSDQEIQILASESIAQALKPAEAPLVW